MLDALKLRGDVEAGHCAVAAHRIEDRVAALHQPTLLVHAPDDPFAPPHMAEWQARLPHARVADIEGGMVPLPDQCPDTFAQAVLHFLDAPA